MSESKLSVIIPTYNRAKYLKAAIDSVLDQAGIDFKYEVVVVDDGSTDNIQQLVEAYGDKIKYLKLTHSGKPAVVRNAGLAQAQGELIAFQDSDDLWVKDKLKTQLDCFKDELVVAAYSNAEYIDKDGKGSGKLLITNGQSRVGDAFDELIAKEKHAFPTNTMVVRKSALAAVGGFNERLIIGTDTECWLRLSTQGKFYYQNQVLGYVRRHGDNISSIPGEGQWLESNFKHLVNKAATYQGVIDNYPQLLTAEYRQKLAGRLVEVYEEIGLFAKKLALAKEDAYREEFHRSSGLRPGLWWRHKKSLYLTQGLRMAKRLHPPTYRKLIEQRDKLRDKRQ